MSEVLKSPDVVLWYYIFFGVIIVWSRPQARRSPSSHFLIAASPLLDIHLTQRALRSALAANFAQTFVINDNQTFVIKKVWSFLVSHSDHSPTKTRCCFAVLHFLVVITFPQAGAIISFPYCRSPLLDTRRADSTVPKRIALYSRSKLHSNRLSLTTIECSALRKSRESHCSLSTLYCACAALHEIENR